MCVAERWLAQRMLKEPVMLFVLSWQIYISDFDWKCQI